AAGVGRNAEALVGLDVDRYLGAFLQGGQERAGGAQVRLAVGLVAQHVHRQVRFLAHALAAGGNRVQALRLRPQRGQQGLVVPIRRPAAQHAHQLVVRKQRRQGGRLGRVEQLLQRRGAGALGVRGQERSRKTGQFAPGGQPLVQG